MRTFQQIVYMVLAWCVVTVCHAQPPEGHTGCTTILVGKHATENGSVMMGHNEDMGRESGRLQFIDRIAPSEKEYYIKYETIPNIPLTNRYWATGNSRPVAETYYEGGWILCGMNEYGVSLSCNSVYTRENRIPKGEGLYRYSIRQLVLERAKSARSAVEMIGDLIDRYTQCDSPVTYCVADSEEVWIVETTYRHWIARRIPDDTVHVVANQYTITTEWDCASDDIITYAIEQGWWCADGEEPFDFKRIYCDPDKFNRSSDTSRELQVREMLGESTGSITVEQIVSILAQPPVQTTLTQSYMVFNLCDWQPKELGHVMWFGMGSAVAGVIVPLYPVCSNIPEAYTKSTLDYHADSAWWQFKRLQELVYPSRWRYADSYLNVRQTLNTCQKEIFNETDIIEKKVFTLLNDNITEKGKALLSEHSFTQLEYALNEIEKILISIDE